MMANTATSLLGQPTQQNSLGDGYSRLRSFSSTTWFGKPHELSPQECANKGWANTGPDQLTCVSCSAQILCKLPLNPWTEHAAGLVKKYTERLVDAHHQGCRHRRGGDQLAEQHTGGGANSSGSMGFPILPMSKLSGAYQSRVTELQQLQLLPQVPASTRAQLAAAAARLDPSILASLAAILQLPIEQLKHEAAAAVVANGSTAVAAFGSAGGSLTREQAISVIALCGWQPRQLLPANLVPTAAGAPGAALAGVAHLLPKRRHSSAAQAANGAGAGSGTAAGSAGSISPACTALECELCGSQVGLWKFCCSGPFYAQQLASKAMQTLAAAAAASTVLLEAAPARATKAAGAESGQQQLKRVLSDSGAGGASPAGSKVPQQPAQASASPEAVFAAMSHTIAGGSLLTAGASGGGRRTSGAGQQRGLTPMGSAGTASQQQQLAPFGSAALPAFGSPAAALGSAGKPPMQQQSPGGGNSSSRLFEGLQALPAASVLGSPNPVAPAAAGPFGAAVAGVTQDAAAPVFGLQAFDIEEQRTKRQRSSATGPAFAAAAAAAIAAHTAGGTPSDAAVPAATAAAAAAAAAAGQRPSTPSTPAGGSSTLGTAMAPPSAGAAAEGGGSAGRVRSYSKQRSGLVAAVAAATGGAAAAEEAVFDPIAAHRSWCPWVKESSRPGSTSGSNAGLVAAVRLGWAATVMAVQQAQQEQELVQFVQGGDGAAGHRDDYSSTAAVLERARQAMDLLERDA